MNDFMVSDDIKDKFDDSGAFQDVARNVVTTVLDVSVPGEHDVHRTSIVGVIRGFRWAPKKIEIELKCDLVEGFQLLGWTQKMKVFIDQITLSRGEDEDIVFQTIDCELCEIDISEVEPKSGLVYLGLKLQR